MAGQLDDLIVMTLALKRFFDTDDKAIRAAVAKYWAGGGVSFLNFKMKR